MSASIRPRVWIAAVALVIGGAALRVGLEGGALWDRLQARQAQALARLARLQGWVDAGPEVAAQVAALFGDDPPRAAVVLERLSRHAAASGARMTELKPQGATIDLGLAGTASSLAAYLQTVAASRPPLQVETLSMASAPTEGAPVLLRLRLRAVPREHSAG